MRKIQMFFPKINEYGTVTVDNSIAIFTMTKPERTKEFYMTYVKNRTAEALKIHWDDPKQAMIQFFPGQSEEEIISVLKQELQKAGANMKELTESGFK